jgi:hypothetical protein
MFPVSRFRGRFRTKTSVSLWTPAQLSTALWLDAADSSTITLNGATVSQWNDKSGNGRNVAQAVATAQPTYNASGLNSKPTLSFDGGDILETPNNVSITINSRASAFIVFQNTGAGAGTQFNFLLSPNFIDIYSATSSQIRWELGTTPTTLGSNTHSITSNTPYIFGGAGKSSFVNGGDKKTFAPTGIISTAINARLRLSGYAGAYVGLISELVFLPFEISDADRQLLEGYLAWKWGGF